MKKEKIITRLAPSPTGLFHIGTARTALFNYLFAKANGGKFILRFEDTDSVRNKPEYEIDILDGLEWLGLVWDDFENPNLKIPLEHTRGRQNSNQSQIPKSKFKTDLIYRQTEHLPMYQEYANKLIKENKAYKKDGAIWFRISGQSSAVSHQLIKYKDLIHGEIQFDTKEFNDFVIIKGDGLPTFMFSNTIDDHEMGITHVIRGDDHITNTPQQILLYRTFKWQPPQFAHIPLILNKDRSKMSKRHDPVSITRDFRDLGYLPEAMINYMVLLGWNPKDNREFFTLVELIKEFELKNVNKSGAIFDIEKLNYFNNNYIQILPIKELIKLISNFQFPISKNKDQKFLEKVISVIKPRMDKLSDFDKLTHYFVKLPEYNSKLLIFKKSTSEATLKGLSLIANCLSQIADRDWESIDKLNDILLETTKAGKLGNGDVFWPVRVAVSGQEKSPSPTDLLWVLGKEKSLERLQLAINKLERLI